jgi:hypothetical protein
MKFRNINWKFVTQWSYFNRFVKDFDYYQKCMLEREREERPALKALKRSRHNSGCLCFSGKSRRDSDKPLVSSSIWLFRHYAARLLSSLCSSICLLFPIQIVTEKPHFLSRSQDFALAQILMHFGSFQKPFLKMSRPENCVYLLFQRQQINWFCESCVTLFCRSINLVLKKPRENFRWSEC